MKCTYSCKSEEHLAARRQFLGGMLAGTGAVVGGLGALVILQIKLRVGDDCPG